jgi:hypothetical protein
MIFPIIGAAFFAFIGAYVLWIRPVEVQRLVRLGKLTEAQGDDELRKVTQNRKHGYLAFVTALGFLAAALIRWFTHT